MNNTHSGCPNDIGKRHFTDYRPSKSLYTDVKNNAEFRKYMQSNGAKIIAIAEKEGGIFNNQGINLDPRYYNSNYRTTLDYNDDYILMLQKVKKL